jgi:hypothetical protein
MIEKHAPASIREICHDNTEERGNIDCKVVEKILYCVYRTKITNDPITHEYCRPSLDAEVQRKVIATITYYNDKSHDEAIEMLRDFRTCLDQIEVYVKSRANKPTM